MYGQKRPVLCKSGQKGMELVGDGCYSIKLCENVQKQVGKAVVG